MTEATRRVTISFSVPNIVHLLIGAACAAAAIAAFATHLQLPAYSIYASDTLAVFIVASCCTLTYWLSCCIQRARAEHKDISDAAKKADQAVRERQEQILTALGAVVSTLTAIADEVGQNRGDIKELRDAMDEQTGALDALAEAVQIATGAVEALQDCYTEEGRLLILPAVEEAPRDH